MAANEVPVRSWSERLLVRRICASDRDACVQLVKAHHGPVYRLLFHLCRDAHLAEDLTQETFAAAWQGSGSFKGSSSLATWLHRIAYRKFVDACRRGRHRVLGEPLDQVSDQVCSNAPGQLESVLADERCRNLYQGLARLEQAERDVLVLHYLQGLSFRQMAEVLAVGPGGNVDGKEIKMYVEPGQRVIYSKYAGTEVKLEGEEFIIVRQSDILAIVE